jgi:glycosyltransferase involved in cell wall biosynthesis
VRCGTVTRVLYVNKFGTARSGAENYFLRLADASQRAGLAVAVACGEPVDVPFSVHTVFEFPVADYRADTTAFEKARMAADVVWSSRAGDVMEAAISQFQPDVVHFHNYYHHLSSSVVHTAARKVPTVMTAHDFKLVCPAYVAFRRGEECFACSDRVSPKLLRDRCLHGDLAWSGVAHLEALTTRLRSAVPHVVIAPSQFMATRLHDSWVARHAEIRHIPNPVDARKGESPVDAGGHVAYVGRLSREKGVDVAIRASASAGVPLRIAGDGPLRLELEALAAGLDAPVEFLGHLGRDAVEREMAAAAAMLMPSRCTENAPLSLLEAVAVGRPVIVSPNGGLPELVSQLSCGIVVPTDDVGAWAHALRRAVVGALPQPDVAMVRERHGWDGHLQALLALYEEVADR